mmetsp:Transcript_3549/g.5497  ORF Transcript_3549/g.5497 Transcript_3549/m.5497 type:complete len:193 (+) Transcript_3549:109-687(+)
MRSNQTALSESMREHTSGNSFPGVLDSKFREVVIRSSTTEGKGSDKKDLSRATGVSSEQDVTQNSQQDAKGCAASLENNFRLPRLSSHRLTSVSSVCSLVSGFPASMPKGTLPLLAILKGGTSGHRISTANFPVTWDERNTGVLTRHQSSAPLTAHEHYSTLCGENERPCHIPQVVAERTLKKLRKRKRKIS